MKRFILLAAVIALLPGCTAQLLAAGVFSVISERDQARPPSGLDPSRPVQEQDCTQPIEHSGGNLRCR